MQTFKKKRENITNLDARAFCCITGEIFLERQLFSIALLFFNMAGRPAGISDGESDEDDFGDYEAPASLPRYRGPTIAPPQVLQNRAASWFDDVQILCFLQVIKQSQVDLDDFRISAMKGNLVAVKSYIESGVPVSQVLRSGWTALMYAASCGRWQVTEYLLEKKANPNFHKELFTPLMAACASAHENEEDLVKCVEILIDHGANINATERHKVTPLMFACKEKRLKIIQTLLQRPEIDVDLQDHRGWSVRITNSFQSFLTRM